MTNLTYTLGEKLGIKPAKPVLVNGQEICSCGHGIQECLNPINDGSKCCHECAQVMRDQIEDYLDMVSPGRDDSYSFGPDLAKIVGAK